MKLNTTLPLVRVFIGVAHAPATSRRSASTRRTATVAKSNDGPEDEKIVFKLENVELGTNPETGITCPCRKIKYERSDDAGRRGRASLRCCRGCELVASSYPDTAHKGVAVGLISIT
jgi:hypothetical protein